MSWYYAENNDRRGPIEDAAFDELVRAGTITPATLVWREGMANWAAFSEAVYVPPIPTTPPPAGGVEMGMCSESGRILPRSELVEIDGRLVSAEYKNIVLQRIREGVGGGGFAEDPETIAQRIEAAGWSLSATSCVGRGWAIVKENFWLCVGATFLVYLVVAAAGMVPLGGLIVQGPLFGGLYWMILKLIRREPASVGDAFQGFNRGWGQLVGVSLITTLLAGVCIIPGVAVMVGAGASKSDASMTLVGIGGLLSVIGFIVAVYLMVGWSMALPLVADKQIPFWPAMKLSRRIVGMHWGQVFSVMFLSGLIMFGFMLVGIGIIVAIIAAASASKDSGLAISLGLLVGLVMAFGFFTLLPLVFSSLCVAYEDIFGARQAE
ncbi:MAG: DUF4339 domain-containing protein [Chthoniobacteraceae bacterium]